jgi:type VI secretion system protein VasG
MASDIKTLVERLNPTCKRALEGAAELCVSHSHFTVEVEHILARLAELPQTDLLQALRQFDIDPSTVNRELSDALNGFKRGNARTPTFSPHVPKLLEEAWVRCSLYLGESAVRSGGLFWAVLDQDGLLWQRTTDPFAFS